MMWDDRRTMAKIAALYYFDGWTQAKIASKYNVSRPVISKALQRAKEQGIVEIYIKDENIHTIKLEQQLEQKYGLKEAIVVSTDGLSDEMVKKTLGKASASYISNNISNTTKLGISWGTTLEAVVEEFPFQKHDSMYIVPLVGGMGRKNVGMHANQLAYELAKKVNGTCTYLYAPAMVDTAELKNRLIESEDISVVLNEGKNVDMALIGIGDPYQGSTMKEIGYLKDEDIKELKNASVVGDISSKFFDANGQQVKHTLNDRVIGIDLHDLKNVKEVVAIANGVYKAYSITTALENNYLDVLITDDTTAKEILA
ncbi:sugar-binding transcriptional regulator [Virgibacillus oceani]|uniref:DeoR family transcriptional regulator n=1 Tax=Virgibacillus oceani TaxID=1479511 RepID=A0A917HBV0_9BACI|nr:sugar-binding transcriptional regulator [Virgibacillus oceani]GGG73547.1 DeoR family transcriptional regulator [Virgibacillus oceani]